MGRWTRFQMSIHDGEAEAEDRMEVHIVVILWTCQVIVSEVHPIQLYGRHRHRRVIKVNSFQDRRSRYAELQRTMKEICLH